MDQEEAPLPASEYPCCIDSLNSLPLHEQSGGGVDGSAAASHQQHQHHDPEIVASTLRQNSIHRWSLSTRTIAHYCRLEQIGEGTYGQVYRAQCLDRTLAHPAGGEIVALKKIRLHHPGYWGIPPTVLREIKILKQLQHKNLVKMFEVVSSKGVEELDWEDEREDEKRKKAKESKASSSSKNDKSNNSTPVLNSEDSNTNKNDNTTSSAITNTKPAKKKKDPMSDLDKLRESYKGNLFLSLEYISHDLTGLLDMAFKFSEVQVKSIARQLLQVLEFMHERNFVHRDLKTSNILITDNFELKLADFGLARCLESSFMGRLFEGDGYSAGEGEFTNKVITLWYRPPELLLGETRYGCAVDIWSAGCIFAEIILGRPIFTGKAEMDQLKLIFDLIGTPTERSWEGFRELKLIRTGEFSIDKQRKPRLRDKYGEKIKPAAALGLLEKLLELDPKKRFTASRALNHRYFQASPIAPDDPKELGKIDLGGDGSGYHEFKTKKRRREAKAVAKMAEDEAKRQGLTVEKQKEAFDVAYREHLQKGASADKKEEKKEKQQQQQQQRSDPRGIHPRDRRVRYRGGSSTGHGRNSFDDDDHTDGGGSYHDSRSMMTDGISRSSRSTYRLNHRSRNNNNMNHPHSPSFTSQQWQMLLIFALGLVLVIKAGIVEVKLEKAQLRGGDRYSHLNHLSGDEYYKAPTVVNGRSLEDGEDEGDVGAGEDSPSETYFKDAVEKLESAGGGGGGDSQGEKEEKEGTEEDQQIEQDLEEGVDDEGEDIISNENNSAGEQQLQQQSSLEFLQSQSSMTQDVNLQQQQLIGQSQFQSQLVGKSPTAQQLLMADFQKFLQGRSDEQIQQPQQQNLFIQQQPQPNQQQQTQFGYQPNQFGQQQLPGQSQYHQQQGPYGQNQNQFGQQVVNQQNYLQYGQQPQQVLPQQFQQQQPQYYQQQQYNPQQNLQLPQQFEPQLQEDVQQQVFAVKSSNEVASPLGQIGNVGNGNLDAIGNEPASPLDYAPVGNVDVFNVAHADQNQAQSDAESQLSQQFDPQLQQDVQQQVFAVKSSNEVASPPDQFENVGDANLNANGNEPASPPDYATVGNLNVIVDANADPTYAQPGAEIDQSPVVEDSPDPLPATDILNNRLVPFDVSLQRRFKGAFKKANDQVDADEAVEDVPIQVQPDAYGTLKESVQPVQEEPTAREPKPADPNNPDWNFKGAVVNDGVAFTNPRLWGAKTLTTPGLRSHLSKNDAKFAPAVV
mmetsp:Transcript_9646/g.15766  ORF Transcript_9646/g.15766 Transcript_9646/m.15766 type:complete len:1241 (+) Transcript_9646:107-3829(+)